MEAKCTGREAVNGASDCHCRGVDGGTIHQAPDSARCAALGSLCQFEGLLFADPHALAHIEPGWHKSEQKLAAVRASFDTPEHINNSYETVPSRRLEKLLQPKYEKVRHGPLAAERITLSVMERECPYFRGWMNQLRALGKTH